MTRSRVCVAAQLLEAVFCVVLVCDPLSLGWAGAGRWLKLRRSLERPGEWAEGFPGSGHHGVWLCLQAQGTSRSEGRQAA